ncbi:MAG: acyl-CoA dehydrogenase [Chloroflexi bacterium]|nr:MAG: acyl-CoA dehydrogenase [Chloroflexota bacterium]
MQEFMIDEEHHMFRDAFRAFLQREAIPHEEAWTHAGIANREVWHKAGKNGFLAMDVPEAYGGMNVKDFRFNAIISEELAYANVSSLGFGVHSDIVVPYFLHYATDAQKQRWLPTCVTGETICAIGMTEPNAGSDVQGIQTTAVKQPDGSYLVNGQKTFITNGVLAGLVVTAVITTPSTGHKGISLLVLEDGMEGFEHSRKLNKMGMKGNDTAELFFSNVRVPAENLLGEEGKGFIYMMQQLPQERLTIAVQAIAGAEAALKETISYCHDRTAFGRPIGKFQNTRFKLAEMKTEITIGRTFVDQCIMELNAGTLTTEKASMAKYWLTDLVNKVVDECVQLHGGYGYMSEYPIAKMYTDTRAGRIYGGTNEIMKEIIGRAMGF